MEIRHLKLIQTVAETENLTRAAEQLHLSQSALSHQLREVEEELGAPLFLRARRRMVLTAAGERLRQTADRVLCELEKAEAAIADLQGKAGGPLRVTVGCYTCYHWLSPVLKQYREQYPEVEVEILPEASYTPLEYLLDGKLDLALTSDRADLAQVHYQPLFEDEFVGFVAPGHPLAQQGELTAADLASETFIMYNISDEKSTVINEFLRPARVQPRKILRLQLTEAIIEMVKAGMGVGVLAEWAVRPNLERGEVIRLPLRPRLRRTWYVASLKNTALPVYMRAFIDLLRRELPAEFRPVKEMIVPSPGIGG